MKVFSSLRLQNILALDRSAQIIIEDNIIPKGYLYMGAHISFQQANPLIVFILNLAHEIQPLLLVLEVSV